MFESKVNKGKAWGYAPLDGTGKVPLGSLPPIQSTIDTSSFATIGANSFTGNQTITGSLTTADFVQTSILQGTGSLFLKPDSNDSRYFQIYNTSPSDTHIKANGGLSYFGDDTNYLKIDDGSGNLNLRANNNITLYTNNGDIILDADGGVYVNSSNSSNGVLTFGYLDSVVGDTGMVNNGSGHTITDNLNNIIANSATLVSNQFNGNQSISGSVNISSSLVVSSTFINNQTLDAINSDLIIEGGYLILTGSAVPTSYTGSNGDKKGMIAVDDNFLYYNTTNYIPQITAGVYNTAVQVHNTWTNDMYGADTIFIQDNGSNPTPQVGWIVTNGTISRTIVSSGYGVNHQNSGFGAMWLLQLDSSANFNSDNTVSLIEQPLTNANWKTAKLNPSPYKNATVESVNYAPFGSGSFNIDPSTEVTILDIDKSIHLLDITDAVGNSHWFLPDGYDGQVVKFALKGNGAQSPNSVYVWMNNLRNYSGQIQSGTTWSPFWDNDGNGYDNPRSLAVAVFIDGAWNIDSDWWGM